MRQDRGEIHREERESVRVRRETERKTESQEVNFSRTSKNVPNQHKPVKFSFPEEQCNVKTLSAEQLVSVVFSHC